MVQPNTACAGFCNWMLNISNQKLSSPQRLLVEAVFSAATMNTPVSDQTWYNFNLFTAWRNKFYLVYRDYAQVIAPGLLTSLISSYNLDGDSNDPVSSNNGTDTAIIYSLANGQINEGAGFNGINSKIIISAITPGPIFSVAFWMKTAPIGSGIQDVITSSVNALGFSIDKASNVLRYYNGGFNSFVTPIIPGNYTCIVMTSDGSNLNMYVDGNLTASYAQAVAGTYLNNIGGATNNNYYFGDLDIINFWQRTLTASDVTAFYNAGTGIQYPF